MSAERDGGGVSLAASALVKLVLPEEESAALVGALADTRELVTSVVGAVETRRAVLGATAGDELAGGRAADILDAVTLVGVNDAIRDLASALTPFSLRSLAAIHLATALVVAPALDAFV